MAAPPSIALLSGAASGVGLATIAGLMDDQFTVVGIDRAGRPEGLVDDSKLGWVTGDVTEQETWERALECARSLNPVGPECLIVCAGDAVFREFSQTSIDDFRRLFEINAL